MKSSKEISPDKLLSDKLLSDLNELQNKPELSENFNKARHDSESRLKITNLFLWWYFALICFSFIFAGIYNYIAAHLNQELAKENMISYLDVSNTVSLITATLSSGVGFVIGYYFKSKGE